MPLVSIIMPAFNSQEYIAQAIESIMDQTYPRFELLIVDDHSTDATPQIIASFTKRFSPIIKAFYLSRHVGDSTSTNTVFQSTRGKYIARMDADDIAHPQRIEKQVSFMLSHPSIMVLGSQAYIIDSNNNIIGEKNVPLAHEEIYNACAIYNPMLHPSCMFVRSLLPHPKKLYEDKKSIHNDYFTFFSYLRYGIFANLPDKLLYYRIHGKNYSLKHPKKRFAEIQEIRQYAIKHFSYTMSFKAKFHNLLQSIFVSLLPEEVILPLYMSSRGMYAWGKSLKVSTSLSTSGIVLPEEA